MRYLIVICLFLSATASADTSVWRVSNGRTELFLAGTIHMLAKADYPLPVEFEQAYQQAQLLILETDLAGMANPDIQQQLVQRLMYSNGQTLKDVLQPETYHALEQYSASRGIAMQSLNQFKPPMVMLTLMMNELQRLGIGGVGVDEYFSHKAAEQGKAQNWLESLETQLNVIANMGKGYEDELILNTIEEMQTLGEIMAEMKMAWRSGDLQKLEQIGLDDMRRDYPALYQQILVARNRAWLPEIEALLATPAKELVLVGALHLVAQEGLLAQLRQRGYSVTRFIRSSQ